MTSRSLTATELRSLLSYNPETGVFTWLVDRDRRPFKGRVAGTTGKTGRRQININGTQYLAHRLAWLWMTGEWPRTVIDHKDLDPSNNRWNNLRLASAAENSRNCRPRPSKHGRGIVYHRQSKLWVARVWVEGREIRVYRKTREAAVEARVSLVSSHYGEFAYGV